MHGALAPPVACGFRCVACGLHPVAGDFCPAIAIAGATPKVNIPKEQQR